MAALDRLPPERRQVFIDAAIDGKTYQQVADEQGIKIGTVMSRLNRARTQLRKELAEYAAARGYGKSTKTSRGTSTAKAKRGNKTEANSVETNSNETRDDAREKELVGAHGKARQ